MNEWGRLLERSPRLEFLTDRQQAIVRRLADGASVEAVAAEFGVAVSTVRNHVAGVRGRVEAQERARQRAAAP